MIEIALYQPDIPQNTATILRLGACLGLKVHIIEPAGFVWSHQGFRRAGMDYVAQVEIVRHDDWASFATARAARRIVLASTKASVPYTDFRFRPGDVLLLGRESAGVPEAVHAACDARVLVPMRPGLRSLNVAMSCAMIAGEAMRQLAWN